MYVFEYCVRREEMWLLQVLTEKYLYSIIYHTKIMHPVGSDPVVLSDAIVHQAL